MKNSLDNQRVYDILCDIPRGRVITYGKLAELIGNKRFARAVGNILHKRIPM